jgi:hypothetical protein
MDMRYATPEEADAQRRRRRLIAAVKESLREVRRELSLFNRHVGASLDLKDVDMGCLDLINRHGPLSPSDLARRARLHPATTTGVRENSPRCWVNSRPTVR